mgnify:FL=1
MLTKLIHGSSQMVAKPTKPTKYAKMVDQYYKKYPTCDSYLRGFLKCRTPAQAIGHVNTALSIVSAEHLHELGGKLTAETERRYKRVADLHEEHPEDDLMKQSMRLLYQCITLYTAEEKASEEDTKLLDTVRTRLLEDDDA